MKIAILPAVHAEPRICLVRLGIGVTVVRGIPDGPPNAAKSRGRTDRSRKSLARSPWAASETNCRWRFPGGATAPRAEAARRPGEQPAADDPRLCCPKNLHEMPTDGTPAVCSRCGSGGQPCVFENSESVRAIGSQEGGRRCSEAADRVTSPFRSLSVFRSFIERQQHSGRQTGGIDSPAVIPRAEPRYSATDPPISSEPHGLRSDGVGHSRWNADRQRRGAKARGIFRRKRQPARC